MIMFQALHKWNKWYSCIIIPLPYDTAAYR